MTARAREPQRTCVSCRLVRDKAAMIRLVSLNGRIVADRAGRLPGRGAYVCDEAQCLARARGKAPQGLREPGAVWSVEEMV